MLVEFRSDVFDEFKKLDDFQDYDYTVQKFKVFGQLNPLEKICYVYRKRKPM